MGCSKMDLSASTYGVSAVMFLIIGGGLLFLGSRYGRGILDFTPPMARGAKALGVIIAFVGIAVAMGWTLTGETASVDSIEVDVSITEDTDQSHIVVDNTDREVRWSVDFNYTGDGTFANQTQYCEVNVSLSREDRNDDDVVVGCEVTDKGLVTDEADGKTYYLINKGSDWAINWTKAGSTAGSTISFQDEDITLSLEDGGTNWVILNVTLRADALDSMELYESEYFYVSFHDVSYAFNVRVINYLGTPPSS